ncbi:MAG: alpha/beta hydrolase, partial [Pseudolysinimonas sp.]
MAFVAQADGLVPQVQSLIDRLERESGALSSYANEVEEIDTSARSLRARQAVTASELATTHSLLRELQSAPADELMDARRRSNLEQRVDDATAQQRKHELEWDELSNRRHAADVSCLDATQRPSGSVITLTTTQLHQLSDGDFLAGLEAMSPSQLLAALRTDPKLATRLSQVTDAQATAAWWRSLGTEPFDPADQSTAQLAIVSAIPAALGNLEGIAYWARDDANRTVLDQRIAAVNKLNAQVDADYNLFTPKASLELAAAGFDSLDDFHHYRDSLLALHHSVSATGDVPRQLVSFSDVDLRHSPSNYDPLAAISVGDLDRAQRVTVDVPGITSTVLASSRDWSAAAQNLYRQEQVLSLRNQRPTSIAVVAWLGYHTPGPLDMVQLWSTHDAQAGSTHLVAFLQGATAAHQWAPGANLSVVAHSYGATTAAFAVSQTPVSNFTMLAPAGLPRSDASVTDLMVPADHVWSTEATGDW